MNIRHNNVDPTDESKYKQGVAELSDAKLEEYYDMIYHLALTLFVLLKQAEANDKINEVKCLLNQKNS